MVPHCDVVTINAPLHPETEGPFGDELFGRMKRGAYLINTARARITDRDAIERALRSGQLAGCAGDVRYPQPAPAHLRLLPLRAGPLRGLHPRDPGVPARGAADP
jgi:formate dehydrogenase